MSSNTPVYVAGLLLGVLPIGSCDTLTTLSIFFIPTNVLYFPGLSLDLYKLFVSALHKISFTKLLFPLPDTPVTQVNVPRGNFTFIFF